MTGAYRKSYFNDVLEKVVKDSEKCVLVILDLDDFKQVNDTYRHQVGDKVLQEFSALVKSKISKNDLFARWGGEEFLLLVEGGDLENTMTISEDIRQTIEKHSFSEIGCLTSSFGVASLKKGENVESLFFRADKALYKAKANGKNQIVFGEI